MPVDFPDLRHAVLCLAGGLLYPSAAQADNAAQHNAVDKIYHPYVQPLEKEIEFRTTYHNDDDSRSEDGVWKEWLSVGRALNEKVFLEAYLIGIRPPRESFRLEAYELEARVQFTEQGQYWADWGLLVEVERERSESVTEISAKLLVEKELGAWALTVNLGPEYEFGSDIEDELDTEFSTQLRYRYSAHFEPAVEVYVDELTSAMGPVVQGLERMGGNRKLHWELGYMLPLNDGTPDSTWRLLLELEF